MINHGRSSRPRSPTIVLVVAAIQEADPTAVARSPDAAGRRPERLDGGRAARGKSRPEFARADATGNDIQAAAERRGNVNPHKRLFRSKMIFLIKSTF